MELARDAKYLLDLAEALESAPIEGATTDDPQGSQTIRMSTTWARETASRLREICGRL